MADIAFASAIADEASGCDNASDLAQLLADHPDRLLPDFTSKVAALAASGADASAALALVEPLASYMLSGAPGGRHLATIVLAGQTEEHHAEGASAALALIGALSMALAGPADLLAAPPASIDEAPLFRFH